MIADDRQARILHELALKGTFTSAEFARRTGVSIMTVRRDLATLEQRGLLERVHGGAITPTDFQGSVSRTPSGQRIAVGMVVPVSGYYFTSIIRGARAAAAELGVRLVLGTSNYSTSTEQVQLARMIAAGVDALIVTPSEPYDSNPSTYRMLSEFDVPAVLLERSIGGIGTTLPLSSVHSDHAHGAELAVRHLAELGHKGIALVWRESATAAPVLAGFRRAADALVGPGSHFESEIPRVEAGQEATQAALDALLRRCRDSGTTAVVVLPDDAAVTLLELAQDAGIHVPADLSVVAYDDEIAALAVIPLTALAPPKADLGYLALRTCNDRLSERRALSAPPLARVELFPSLVIRESTGVAPGQDGRAVARRRTSERATEEGS